MKQKYNITVADMQLNIVSDASAEEVENVVGILDRRMRDIALKSPRCTKNEAAILCALSYCSERLAVQEAYKKVEKDAQRYSSENERLKKEMEDLRAEAETLRREKETLQVALDEAVRKAEEAKTAETPAETPVGTPAAEVPAMKTESGTPTVEESEEKNKANKSRVGTMFDLLTFSDV